MIVLDFAEFAGILLGDGSIGIYPTKATNRIKMLYTVKVTLDSREVQYGKYVAQLFMRLLGGNPMVIKTPNQNVQNIVLHGKKYTDLLQNIGFILSPKWKRAIIPNCFMQPDLELLVVRGYFDTDGSVVVTNNNGTIYPRLEMKISPSPMQAQFIEILKRHNFHFGIYQIGKGKVRIQLNGKEQLEKWYREIGFSNLRHLEKAERLLQLNPIRP